jgi:hypothetical protein
LIFKDLLFTSLPARNISRVPRNTMGSVPRLYKSNAAYRGYCI